MKREYTKFGEELRVLRTRRHQNQQEMADFRCYQKLLINGGKGEETCSGEMDRHSDRVLSSEVLSMTIAGRCS